MDIQKQIEFEKFHARECNCDYDELKRRLDHQEKVMGHRYIPSSPRHEAWLVWNAAWKAKAQAVPEWISVEDEFPKKNLKVLLNLVTRKNGKPIKCIGFYSIEPDEEPCFVLDDNFTELKGVTHWVRLPDSPKAQEQSHD